MCGIAGFIDAAGRVSAEARVELGRRMGDTLAHRGPDDSGEWQDPECGVVLAHRRLSIIDLTREGHQPMSSAAGRYVIVYNGEIYNFRELAEAARRDNVVFRGSSDTEVLLATIERYGVERALERMTGMFAFAVWDRGERALYLARDRLGEKPLYYGWIGSSFVFASELKALQPYPGWAGQVDPQGLASLFRYGYVRNPGSIYKDIYKLVPGTSLRVDSQQVSGCDFSPHPDSGHGGLRPRRYWSLDSTALGSGERHNIDEETAARELDDRLTRVVDRQRIADVPLGALLSGGIDSSLIVALMQKLSNRPVRTFTIGFDEAGFNEAGHAKAVANHLGTDHTELYVTPAQAREVIPRLPAIYDEPFADSSQIPTCLVSELARSGVTVALSGDGGDELFGGYTRYGIASAFWSKSQRYPAPLRRAAAGLLAHVPGALKDKLLRIAERLGDGRVPVSGRRDQFDRLLHLVTVNSFPHLYDELVAHWKSPRSIMHGDVMQEPAGHEPAMEELQELYEQMMYIDTGAYLPDDILTKVDRAAMAVSLEVRVPLLDHNLVEWIWQLPFQYKVQNGREKHLLRKVLYNYVPRELVDRPKMGFGIPMGDWLRGPLREWAEELLSVPRLQDGGFLRPEPIRAMWAEHQHGRSDWHYYLWDVLMFQAWRAEYP